jgi:hypothetical protein
VRPEVGFAIYAIAALGTVALNFPFVAALKASYPELYASFGSPQPWRFLFRGPVVMPYSNFLMWRRFVAALPSGSPARGWAEALFFAHWLQVLGLGIFFADVFVRLARV